MVRPPPCCYYNITMLLSQHEPRATNQRIAVAIRRGAEPQMQHTSMFFLKLFGYCSCQCFAVGRGCCCACSQQDLVIAIFNA
jgi:hypothetical protein